MAKTTQRGTRGWTLTRHGRLYTTRIELMPFGLAAQVGTLARELGE